MQKLIDGIETLNEWIGRAVGWLTLVMVGVMFLVVVLRYVFDTGYIALQESVTWMHALVFMLGAAYTLKYDAHVRVDVLYRNWSSRRQAWANLLGVLFLLLPVCMLIIWQSADYVARSWRVFEASGETGGLPGVFLLKTAIPVTALLLLLQGIALALRSALTLAGRGTESG